MDAHVVVRSHSACLRARTRDEHEALEAALDVQLLGTPSGLVSVLRGWVAVWHQVGLAAVDPGATATAAAELLGPSEEALDWLAADLAGLAPAADETPRQGAAADDAHALALLLADPSATWGVTYVLRGSRLGGRVLAPLVRDALELPSESGTRFLASQGTDPAREWVSFRRRLDGVELTAVELTTAVEAARWTFRWVGAVTLPGVQRTAPGGRVAR